MRKIILGRSNRQVSSVSLGTWAYGGKNMSGKISVGWAGQNIDDSKKALIKAWELGINHWDTADVYGDGKSEKIIGESWGQIPRKNIFLATKVGWDRGPYDYWYNPKHMLHNMERSLKNLKTDYVDLLYLHHCNFGKNGEYLNAAIDVVKKFQEQGKARLVGLSDWSCKKIVKYIKQCDPDVVQPYRNVMDDQYEESGLRDYVEKFNIGVCFFSPIKHGLLLGKYNKPARFEAGDHRIQINDFINQKIINKMKTNKKLLEERFSFHKNPVLYGVVNALFNDSSTACVLLGQRNVEQVYEASLLGDIISKKDSDWIKSLYLTQNQ